MMTAVKPLTNHRPRGRRLLALGALLGVALSACGETDGMTFVGSVDDSALTERQRAGRALVIAAWVGREPEPGQRPDAVTPYREVENLRGDAGLNAFFWQTRLRPAEGARLYLGAFYELEADGDGVPQAGDQLSWIGPLPTTSEELSGLQIRMLPEDGIVRPSVAARIENLESALVSGELSQLTELIHPFYGDPWGLDFEDLAAWTRGASPGAATVYTTPVSAPLAGFMSPATRSALSLANVTLETDSLNESSLAAILQVGFSIATGDGSRINLRERWITSLLPTPDDLLFSRFFIQIQDVEAPSLHHVRIATNEVLTQDEGIVVQWRDTANSVAVAYQVGLDRYDPDNRVWLFEGNSAAIPVRGSAEYQVVLGLGLQAAVQANIQSDAFYRIRVHPIDDEARVRVPSVAFVRGADYLR